MSEENNIFDYATKELSQDAVICWMLNWVNYTDSELHNLGKDMFALIGEENVNVNQKITIHRQVKNADIVVVLHGDRKIIIIEDKVYSSEHDDQLKRYREDLAKEEVQRDLKIEGEIIKDINVVYFKTGFYYDVDKNIKNADVFVNGEDFLNRIKGYEGKTNSEILECYIKYLEKLLNYYKVYGDFRGKYDDGVFYVCWEYIAQHNLMREFFPEENWEKDSGLYMVYNGSSSGRPWTELEICSKNYSDGDGYCIFWRVDSDKNGPYLSLRFYDKFDKNNTDKKNRHQDYYDKMVSFTKDIIGIDNINFNWEDVDDGYKGSYYESSLMTIKLTEYLNTWDEKGKVLINTVRLINDKFVEGIDEAIK